MMPTTSRASGRPMGPPLRWAWYATFAASGAASLIYQVVWQRKLALALGTSAQSSAIVLAAFMGGLALGAAWTGRRAPAASGRRLYAGAEAALVVLAVAGAFALDQLPYAYIAVKHLFGGAGAAARAVLAAAALLPPTFCMGVTFPALVREFGAGGRAVGPSAGALAAANTCGALLGVAAAAFALIPSLGFFSTTLAAAALNAASAGAAFLLPNGNGSAAAENSRGEKNERLPAVPMMALAAGGFALFAQEILWSRALVYSIGDNSAYAFAEMLATVLLGLMLGGAAAAAASKFVRRPLAAAGWLHILFAGAVAAGICMLRPAESLADRAAAAVDPGTVHPMGSFETFAAFLQRAFIECARIILPAAMISGAAYPFAVRALAGDAARSGRAVGVGAAVNTLGAVAGALAGGMILLPTFGFQGSMAACAALAAASGAACIAADASAPGARRFAPSAAGFGAASILILFAAHAPPHWERALTKGRANFELLHYRDGAAASVGVVRRKDTDDRVLWVDGDAQAGTDPTMKMHLILLGQLGACLHPAPRTALVVGLGCGVTLGALATHPLERIDVAELSPEVRDAAHYFDKANRRAYADPRVTIHFEDGRNFLLASPGGYDVITSDPIDPDDAGVTSLYSREYFELVAQKLNPGGTACHWIPTQYSTEVYASLVEAFRSAFPQCWLFDADFTTVIVGRKPGGAAPSFDDLDARVRAGAVRESLAECGVSGAADLLALRLAGSEGIDLLTRDGSPRPAGAPAGDRRVPANCDDRPIAEYEGSRCLWRRTSESSLEKYRLMNLGRGAGVAGLVTPPEGAAAAAVEQAGAAAARAFEARLLLGDQPKDWAPALRARLFALRLPAPRFVDALCGLDAPEALDAARSSLFDAGLDALEARDYSRAMERFAQLYDRDKESPRAALGAFVTALDAKDAATAFTFGAATARLVPRFRSVSTSLLKVQVERMIRGADDPHAGATFTKRLLECVPSLRVVEPQRRLETWKATHRRMRLDPQTARFELAPDDGRDAKERPR